MFDVPPTVDRDKLRYWLTAVSNDDDLTTGRTLNVFGQFRFQLPDSNLHVVTLTCNRDT